jgi:hypothetical protein
MVLLTVGQIQAYIFTHFFVRGVASVPHSVSLAGLQLGANATSLHMQLTALPALPKYNAQCNFAAYSQANAEGTKSPLVCMLLI